MAKRVARLEEGRSAFKILTHKPTGKRPLGRSRRRWEDNIWMDLEEIGGIVLIRLRIGHCNVALNCRFHKPWSYLVTYKYFLAFCHNLFMQDVKFKLVYYFLLIFKYQILSFIECTIITSQMPFFCNGPNIVCPKYFSFKYNRYHFILFE